MAGHAEIKTKELISPGNLQADSNDSSNNNEKSHENKAYEGGPHF